MNKTTDILSMDQVPNYVEIMVVANPCDCGLYLFFLYFNFSPYKLCSTVLNQIFYS